MVRLHAVPFFIRAQELRDWSERDAQPLPLVGSASAQHSGSCDHTCIPCEWQLIAKRHIRFVTTSPWDQSEGRWINLAAGNTTWILLTYCSYPSPTRWNRQYTQWTSLDLTFFFKGWRSNRNNRIETIETIAFVSFLWVIPVQTHKQLTSWLLVYVWPCCSVNCVLVRKIESRAKIVDLQSCFTPCKTRWAHRMKQTQSSDSADCSSWRHTHLPILKNHGHVLFQVFFGFRRNCQDIWVDPVLPAGNEMEKVTFIPAVGSWDGEGDLYSGRGIIYITAVMLLGSYGSVVEHQLATIALVLRFRVARPTLIQGAGASYYPRCQLQPWGRAAVSREFITSQCSQQFWSWLWLPSRVDA